MIYREVPASSVLPLSSVSTTFSIADLENFFDTYFYKLGPGLYHEYKKAQIQSSGTFLKDLFKNIKESIKEGPTTEKDSYLSSLLIDSVVNQIIILEEFFKDKKPDVLNAIISGIVVKSFKKYFLDKK